MIVFVSSIASAGRPADEVTKLVDLQIKAWSKAGMDLDGEALYVAGARFTVTGDSRDEDGPSVDVGDLARGVIGAEDAIEEKLSNRTVTVSRDGKTAWTSFEIAMKVEMTLAPGEHETYDRNFRVTELAVATKDGWKLAGGMWSSPEPNDAVNRDARAGKRKLGELPAASDSKTLLDVYTAMLATKTPATAKDLVAIGSASGERTVGGATFAKAWDATWRGHVTALGQPIVRVAPSGTTGWVTANVALTKKVGAASYAIPFRLFLVFDQGDGGAWTLAQVHFAVAAK